MIKRLFFFFIVALALLTACSDNDSFTTDRSHRLTFTTDTVRMDTLFATIPSSTYSFWVHNKSGDGLRLRSVRLERSGQSGFRVNVDGTFLNPVANNLEIREGDSIRVFVEVTAFENASAEPQLIEDNLLFTLESGVEQKVNLRTYSWNAEQWREVEITESKTIESSKPIVVYGGISVAATATLTIKNTEMYFHDGAGITVEGALVAENSLFRGDRLDHMFDYLPYDRVSGQWQGITIKPHADGCQLTDCEIRNACDGLVADTTTVELYGSTIHNCKGSGLWAHDSEVTVINCVLSNTLKDCMTLLGCQTVLDRVTLAQFYPLSANRGFALRFEPSKQPFTLTCTNTLVTGYAEDVIDGEVDENSQYNFTNCLLRTVIPDDTQFFKDIIWEKKDDEIQGTKHFVLIDDRNMIYDFRLKEESPAYEKKIGKQ
ncbi:MAG: right-handed parallel beta-helix repeat-containing protein [Prevotella sp.]|nr:right-handed parallel beta-helix repeat-containing protein [Prevotella sp.]